MELSLIRNLMDKDFYDGNKGTRCPDKLFTKDVQKIKHAIDNAMEKAWTEIHSRVIPFKGDLQKEMEVITRKNIIEGNY